MQSLSGLIVLRLSSTLNTLRHNNLHTDEVPQSFLLENLANA